MTDGWRTDEDLVAARNLFAATVAGYVPPAAYALARRDADDLVFGHVNRFGEARGLPAAALATVCGYSSSSGTYEVSGHSLADVLRRLTPAEAATHVRHPNIWSWRQLLDEAPAGASLVAFYWVKAADKAQSSEEEEFLRLAGAPAG